MRTDEIAAVGALLVVTGGLIAIFAPLLARRAARAKQRLDLLQQSLQHPQLDPATRNQILLVLANEHEANKWRWLTSRSFWQRVIFGGGWLLFVFFGGVAALAMSNFLPKFIMQSAFMLCLLGLALMTLPYGLGELARRNRQLAD